MTNEKPKSIKEISLLIDKIECASDIRNIMRSWNEILEHEIESVEQTHTHFRRLLDGFSNIVKEDRDKLFEVEKKLKSLRIDIDYVMKAVTVVKPQKRGID